MGDSTFEPNWASPPGDTIRIILHTKGLSFESFGQELGLKRPDVDKLIAGVIPIDRSLASGLVKSIGSTARFWLERQKQYQKALEHLAAAEPELQEWSSRFPLRKMIDAGWMNRPLHKSDAAFELLDYFDVASVSEWRDRYVSRLDTTHFRTSAAFEDNPASTTAWLRYGELRAESIQCDPWNRQSFEQSLVEIKRLTNERDPQVFIPSLTEICARVGVVVVVERCVDGCTASGATYMLDAGKALLMVSGRFLSDDQFWFSFFHEAGHLLLHGDTTNIDAGGYTTPSKEDEANEFAQSVILSPASEKELLSMPVNKFSIVRLARRCNVAPGLIVGQLQHRNRISPKLFNKFKVRYQVGSFSL
jgi:Zn-dependent peptidase ImmA (M78 family)/plasmid maintenance system antidote protein VapI